jgi:hypothetical protein
MMTLRMAVLLLAVVAALPGSAAQAPAVSVEALVARAGRYVEDYEKAFSALVCEERQTQRLVRPDGSTEKQRDLVSDFLLVKAGSAEPQAFRDVLEVDGRPVRGREERLRKLFLDNSRTAAKQAEAISKESSRYNIGVSRTPNSPLVPLEVLHPRSAPRFHFRRTPDGAAFEEFRSPSLVRQRTLTGTRDVFCHGSCAIDPETGRVLGVTLSAGGASTRYEMQFDVRYDEEPTLRMLVPVEYREALWRPAKPKDSRLVVVSTYSNFRRFQVTTEEQIRIPK